VVFQVEDIVSTTGISLWDFRLRTLSPQQVSVCGISGFDSSVENFRYLGVILNGDNNNQIHVQERIKNANKTYFMLQNFFKNKKI
jgi:hypothetical protein